MPPEAHQSTKCSRFPPDDGGVMPVARCWTRVGVAARAEMRARSSRRASPRAPISAEPAHLSRRCHLPTWIRSLPVMMSTLWPPHEITGEKPTRSPDRCEEDVNHHRLHLGLGHALEHGQASSPFWCTLASTAISSRSGVLRASSAHRCPGRSSATNRRPSRGNNSSNCRLSSPL